MRSSLGATLARGSDGKHRPRKHNRYKVAFHTIVFDRLQQNAVRCMIRDGSISGCKIVSVKVFDLPDKVLLKIPNLDQLIRGRIVWRNKDSAGIEFEWEANRPDDRRNAPRQEAAMRAAIKDYDLNKLADCIILDASRTGCRISSKALATLPDDILIEIQGLTEPVLALIVWRNGNMAGLKFVWQSDVYMLDDSMAM